MMDIARLLHLLGVVIWVGGMFFANFALRPSVALLEPAPRVSLLAAVFTRFLAWIALAIVLIVASGVYLIEVRGGFAAAGSAVHAMLGLGALMIVIYAVIVAGPYRRVASAVRAKRYADAGPSLQRIRMLVALNLALGLVTVVIAVLGVVR